MANETGVMVLSPAEERAAPEATPGKPQLAMLYRRVLAGDTGLVQVWFDQAVLDKYRDQAGVRVLRSNSAGRVRVQGGWSLDFGIADGDRLIHASAGDLARQLPKADQQHWLNHVVAPPASGTFLVMRMGAGHCIEDGDIRTWSSHE
ncbi:MAG: hypothetical protein U0893_12105 [Chloroflexota bacterium]